MSTREIFREIGVLLIGFMIYDSLYRPWTPLADRFVPGLTNVDTFSFAKMAAILLVLVSIYVVFWLYDFAIRVREEALKDEIENNKATQPYRGSFWSLYGSDDDEDFGWENVIFADALIDAARKAAIVYTALQYVVSVLGLSIFAWLALGLRQAFCVFVGTVCILDVRKVWGLGEEQG